MASFMAKEKSLGNSLAITIPDQLSSQKHTVDPSAIVQLAIFYKWGSIS
jgi:antitoxin component of MazEF toxin-antitoxin module